jgi:hypothetical protein
MRWPKNRLGKKGTTRHDVEKLSTITDRFLDYCLGHLAENGTGKLTIFRSEKWAFGATHNTDQDCSGRCRQVTELYVPE